jgi:hypothetical protein
MLRRKCWIKLEEARPKLSDRAIKGYYVGNAHGSDAYNILLSNGTIKKSRNVRFISRSSTFKAETADIEEHEVQELEEDTNPVKEPNSVSDVRVGYKPIPLPPKGTNAHASKNVTMPAEARNSSIPARTGITGKAQK